MGQELSIKIRGQLWKLPVLGPKGYCEPIRSSRTVSKSSQWTYTIGGWISARVNIILYTAEGIVVGSRTVTGVEAAFAKPCEEKGEERRSLIKDIEKDTFQSGDAYVYEW